MQHQLPTSLSLCMMVAGESHRGSSRRSSRKVSVCERPIAPAESVMLNALSRGPHERTPIGCTVLHYAALANNVPVMEAMIKLGVDVNARNNQGETPLFWATHANSLDSMRLLIASGARLDCVTRESESVVAWAVQSGHAAALKLLIESGASPDGSDSSTERPLHVAIREDNSEMVRLLLYCGADQWLFDEDGFLPIHTTAETNNFALARILLDCGGRLHAATSDGCTRAIMVAAAYGATEFIQQALSSTWGLRLPLNDQDCDGLTALHWSLSNGHHDTATCLVMRGASLHVPSRDHLTPIDLLANQPPDDKCKQLLSLVSKHLNQMVLASGP